jgi:hypothetical protein
MQLSSWLGSLKILRNERFAVSLGSSRTARSEQSRFRSAHRGPRGANSPGLARLIEDREELTVPVWLGSLKTARSERPQFGSALRRPRGANIPGLARLFEDHAERTFPAEESDPLDGCRGDLSKWPEMASVRYWPYRHSGKGFAP